MNSTLNRFLLPTNLPFRYTMYVHNYPLYSLIKDIDNNCYPELCSSVSRAHSHQLTGYHKMNRRNIVAIRSPYFSVYQLHPLMWKARYCSFFFHFFLLLCGTMFTYVLIRLCLSLPRLVGNKLSNAHRNNGNALEIVCTERY